MCGRISAPVRMLFVDGVSVPVSQELAPHEGALGAVNGERILKLRSKCYPHRSPELLVLTSKSFSFSVFLP